MLLFISTVGSRVVINNLLSEASTFHHIFECYFTTPHRYYVHPVITVITVVVVVILTEEE